jgi:four helix bundle protein
MDRGYRSLAVWRRSRELAIAVYQVTGEGKLRHEWGMRDQIRRSALSVPSNIAEGSARASNRDTAHFFIIARGSLAELATQADIAAAVGLLDPITAEAWQAECGELGAMLTQLIANRR